MRPIHLRKIFLWFSAIWLTAALCAIAQTNESSPTPQEQANPSVLPLRQIVLADSPELAQKLSLQPGSQFVVAMGALKHLEGNELTKRLIAAKDRVVDRPLLEGIAQAVSIYARQHGYLVCNISVPDQNISDGVLRIAVVPGKFRQIKFVGNRWFSESQLLDDLQVGRGEIIRASTLDEAVGWTNDSNPFRRLQAQIQQVPNSNEADLIVGVQERPPLRLVAVVDTAGNSTLGENHYTFAATYANLWRLDHQATYQYITTNEGQNFAGHVFSYRAPLPWHHFLQLNATYLRARPLLFGGYFNQDAENITGDLRYTIPLRKRTNPAELSFNLSFKESNNDLQFGGTSVQSSKTDIFELSFGASELIRDNRGAWAFGLNATFSPGRINSRNTDEAFSTARGGASASYAVATLSVQRGLALEHGWEFNSRGSLQMSTANLLSSEQLGVGGAATVRGFSESVFAGDEGFVFGNDLVAPPLRQRFSIMGKQFVPLETRFLAFYDAAHVRSKHGFALDAKYRPLASTGLGMRMIWANNFSLTFDYGWQITHLPYPVTEHGRGHVKVMLAY